MAQQVLDTVGSTDNLQTGGNKINANFSELYGITTTAVQNAVLGQAGGVATLNANGKIPAGQNGAEPALGNPATDGEVLTSTALGVRSFKKTGINWTTHTATYTSVVGDGVLADTTLAAFTVALPAIVALGDTVSFVDALGTWATNNLTIATTGTDTIQGAVSPMLADVSKNFSLVAATLSDWRIF